VSELVYRNEFILFDQGKPASTVIRNYIKADFDQLIEIQSECFPPPFPSELWWNKEQLTNHVTLFPDGAFCAEVNGHLAGSLTGLCIDFDPDHIQHSWSEITDQGYIRTHNPKGNSLYIVDISVRPKYRKLGLGKLMMQAMYHVVIKNGYERLLGGGRIPGYHTVSDRMTAEEYVNGIMEGKWKDPVISFLLSCGRVHAGIIENYLEDEESCNNAVLMEWKNPFLNE
jgi:ribosomal protein S18 acetylase RimI-like enzyme